jgi:hypothetical protein
MHARLTNDALRICDSLVRGDPCVAGAHVVDRDGRLAWSVPMMIDDGQAAEVSRVGRLLAKGGEPRPCVRAMIDEVMSCIGMDAGNGEALVVVFFDDPAVVARLPRLMALAVRELRGRARWSGPPGGGPGGTPSEARAFVSVEDLDDHDA